METIYTGFASFWREIIVSTPFFDIDDPSRIPVASCLPYPDASVISLLATPKAADYRRIASTKAVPVSCGNASFWGIFSHILVAAAAACNVWYEAALFSAASLLRQTLSGDLMEPLPLDRERGRLYSRSTGEKPDLSAEGGNWC